MTTAELLALGLAVFALATYYLRFRLWRRRQISTAVFAIHTLRSLCWLALAVVLGTELIDHYPRAPYYVIGVIGLSILLQLVLRLTQPQTR